MIGTPIKDLLEANRAASFPEVKSIHGVDIAKVDDSCFIGIFPQTEKNADNGANTSKCVTQVAWVCVFKKIGQNSIVQVKGELDTIGSKVEQCLRGNPTLDGFCIRGKVVNVEKGSTVHKGDRFRYYRVDFEGKFFGG